MAKAITREVGGRKFKIYFTHFSPGIAEIHVYEIILKKRLFGKGMKECEVPFTNGLAMEHLEAHAIQLIHRKASDEKRRARFDAEFAALGD